MQLFSLNLAKSNGCVAFVGILNIRIRSPTQASDMSRIQNIPSLQAKLEVRDIECYSLGRTPPLPKLAAARTGPLPHLAESLIN